MYDGEDRGGTVGGWSHEADVIYVVGCRDGPETARKFILLRYRATYHHLFFPSSSSLPHSSSHMTAFDPNTNTITNTGATSHPWATGKCVVLFSAPWCGHCQRLKGTWSAFTKAVRAQHPDVRVMTVDTDTYDTRSVRPDVFGFPTIRAYKDGKVLSDFDADRTQAALLQFVGTHFGSSSTTRRGRKTQTAGRTRRRTRTRASTSASRRRRHSQRGGGASTNAAPAGCCGSAIGKPFDVPSKVAGGEQWSGPYDQAPSPPYNGGLYTGPPASGPHAPIPVTPTAAKYIHENLRSASGTPQSTTQYPTAATHRPGNNWSAMPGVSNFAKQGTGPHRIHCTGDAPSATGVTGGRRRRRAATRRQSRRRGGLQLRAANMDDGAPFHPEWAQAQAVGGRRANKAQRRKRRARGGSSSSSSGLRLRAPNMDNGAPFHPEWA